MKKILKSNGIDMQHVKRLSLTLIMLLSLQFTNALSSQSGSGEVAFIVGEVIDKTNIDAAYKETKTHDWQK